MNSDNSEIEKLLQDESFRNWALCLNQDDVEKWEELMKKDKALAQRAQEAQSIVLLAESAEGTISEEENQAALALLESRIEEEVQRADRGRRLVSRQNTSVWFKYAAAVILLLIGAGTYFTFSWSSRPLTEIVKVSGNGEQLAVNLPDGSSVLLNANSKLIFADDFSEARIVRLSGEAFFEVVPDKELPFKVIAQNFTTEVLGTSFNISSYQNEPEGKISVVSGKVKVNPNQDNGSSIVLVKNEAAQFDARDGRLKPAAFKAEDLLWRKGMLLFQNAGITSIAQKLEQQFDYQVKIINPEKLEGEFNGRYEEESMENILEGMSYILNFSYDIDKKQKKVTIKPNE